jgi:hypothetical protein
MRDGRCPSPPSCPPGQTKVRDGQCCDPKDVHDGRCAPTPPAGTCPRGETQLSNGQCCDPKTSICRVLGQPQPSPCPTGDVKLSNGQCCDPNRDSTCHPVVIRKSLRHEPRPPHEDEPREPTRHGTSFHVHIPSSVVVQPRGPSSTGGRGTISAPHSGGRILR